MFKFEPKLLICNVGGFGSEEYPVYSGGSCVHFTGSMRKQICCMTLLYKADAAVNTPLTVSYTVKDISICISVNCGIIPLAEITSVLGITLKIKPAMIFR